MPSFMGKNFVTSATLQPDILNSLRPRIDVGDGPILNPDPFKPVVVKPPVSTNVGTIVTGPILLDPRILSELLVKAVWAPRPRSQVTVPISPNVPPTADTLFEDHADPNKKYALPTFNLCEETLSGKPRLKVSLERVQQADPANLTWQLTVYFRVARRRPDAEDLPFTPTVLLRFTPPSAGATPREIPLTVEPEDGMMKASLQLNGINARDEVVNAIKSFAYQTHFIVRCSFTAAVPDPNHSKPDAILYRQNGYSVDVQLNRELFVFDPSQYPYIFSEVQDASEKVFGEILHQLDYKGRIHHYFQDEARPWIFYFLPDAFKVTRGTKPPFAPNMTLSFRSEEVSDDSSQNGKKKTITKASLNYQAVPVTDAERLDAARLAFKSLLPTPMPPDKTDAEFLPIIVDEVSQLTFSLGVSRDSNSPRVPRPGVVTNLREPFEDTIRDLELENDFQALWDSLFSASPAEILFTGDVRVAKSGERPEESIPFNARLDDLYGPLLQETETPGADGRITVKLKNGIESPLTVRSVPVHIMSNHQLFPAHIENLSKGGTAAQFPIDLLPEEEVSLEVVADQPLPADTNPPDALFGLDDVIVKPDKAAVLDAILDTSVPAQYSRPITVNGVAEWFAPDTDVLKLSLEFENGDFVVLDRQNLSGKAYVRTPVRAFILREEQKAEYLYTQTVITTKGPNQTEKTDHSDLLWPNLTA